GPGSNGKKQKLSKTNTSNKKGKKANSSKIQIDDKIDSDDEFDDCDKSDNEKQGGDAVVKKSLDPINLPSRPAPRPKGQGVIDNSSKLQSSKDTVPPSKLFIPARPLAQPSASAGANKTLDVMKKMDAAYLVPPVVDEIEVALDTRYSSLVEAEKVRAALETLRLAESCGLAPETEGDAGFLQWLNTLQTVELPDVPLKEQDEDKIGSGFAHDEIGSWSYRTTLNKLESWGGVDNACRLLTALLRIWSMSKDQLRQLSSTLEPIVKTHISQACDLIDECFKIASGPKETSNAQATRSSSNDRDDDHALAKDISNTIDSVSVGASTEVSKKKVKAKRGQVEKNLDNGIVNEEVIGSLSKRAAMKLLDLGGIQVRKAARADEVQRTLNQALVAGKVSITAKQIRQAESKLEVEGTIRVDPKGKGKAKA
ncbi:hypothetical protein CF326_g9284, partial [Tilletia indica]